MAAWPAWRPTRARNSGRRCAGAFPGAEHHLGDERVPAGRRPAGDRDAGRREGPDGRPRQGRAAGRSGPRSRSARTGPRTRRRSCSAMPGGGSWPTARRRTASQSMPIPASCSGPCRCEVPTGSTWPRRFTVQAGSSTRRPTSTGPATSCSRERWAAAGEGVETRRWTPARARCCSWTACSMAAATRSTSRGCAWIGSPGEIRYELKGLTTGAAVYADGRLYCPGRGRPGGAAAADARAVRDRRPVPALLPDRVQRCLGASGACSTAGCTSVITIRFGATRFRARYLRHSDLVRSIRGVALIFWVYGLQMSRSGGINTASRSS